MKETWEERKEEGGAMESFRARVKHWDLELQSGKEPQSLTLQTSDTQTLSYTLTGNTALVRSELRNAL